MNSALTGLPAVDELDADGAIREMADQIELDGSTRADALRKAVIGGGAFLGGTAFLSALPSLAAASTSGTLSAANRKNDVAILNFALTLEYLESAFYVDSLKEAGLSGQLLRFARVVSAHEGAHVVALKKTIPTLGGKPVARPKFKFGAATGNKKNFTATSMVLEDTGVKAYQGQAGNIKLTPVLAAALAIHPVEARHAAWIRAIAGKSPAPAAFNPALTKAQVLAAVKGTGFIVGL